MLYDQTQAFFDGFVAVVARVGGAMAAFLLAYACYGVVFLDQEGFLFSCLLAPFTVLYMIGVWSEKFGIGVFLGLAAIIMALYFAWCCLHTDDLHKTLGLVFACTFVYFFPIVNFDDLLDVAIWLLISGTVVALYFCSPKLMEILLVKLEKRLNVRRNRVGLKLLLRRVKRLWRSINWRMQLVLETVRNRGRDERPRKP